MTTIILVRHGQTEWNRDDRFRGHADVPPDNTGVAQAEATAARIVAQWKPVAVYAGPLSRTIRTGEAVAQSLDLRVEVEQGLLDVNCGEWQGLNLDEVRRRWRAEFNAYLHAPAKFRFPGGESLEHARDRAWKSTQRLAGRHSDETIVLVSHTALNRLILLSLLGLDSRGFWRLRQDTCGISVFELGQARATLLILNDTSHLLPLFTGRKAETKSSTV